MKFILAGDLPNIDTPPMGASGQQSGEELARWLLYDAENRHAANIAGDARSLTVDLKNVVGFVVGNLPQLPKEAKRRTLCVWFKDKAEPEIFDLHWDCEKDNTNPARYFCEWTNKGTKNPTIDYRWGHFDDYRLVIDLRAVVAVSVDLDWPACTTYWDGTYVCRSEQGA